MTNNDELARNPVLAYADSYRSMANQGTESVPVWGVITDLERNIAPLYSAMLAERDTDKKRIADMQSIVDAAEKLVRCKGRYHSEQKYRALAALFGVTVPDLPPLETESRTVSVKLPDNTQLSEAPEHIWLQTAGEWPATGEFSELTWCSDRQHPDDTLYVRADLAAGIKLEVGGAIMTAQLSREIEITDAMALAFHQATTDSSAGSDDIDEIKTGLRAALANYSAPPAPVAVPDVGEFRIFTQTGGVKVAVKDGKTKNHLFGMGWNDCRAATLNAGPVTGWIKCSDRMPDETQPVITVAEGGVVQRTVYQFCDGVWVDWYEQYDEVKVDAFTHWMPLPAAPEQEV